MALKIPTKEIKCCLYKMFYIFTHRNFVKEAHGNIILVFF
jgi:hypothetical protein